MTDSSSDDMASYTFDTLTYAKELIAAGMPEQQAEVISLRQRTLIENELATKADIAAMRQDMKSMETDLKKTIKTCDTDLRKSMDKTDTDLRKSMKQMDTELRKTMQQMDMDLKRTIAELETNLRHDINALALETKHNLKAMESTLTLRLGSIVVVALGALTTIGNL
jgi:hypothetical protein